MPDTERQLRRAKSTRNQNDFARMIRLFERPGLISEGDSWFAYPAPPFSGKPANIIDHLQDRTAGRVNLLRLESNGDEMSQMMAGHDRHTITRLLKQYADRNRPIAALLFSAGGNDVVGTWDLERFLRPHESGFTAEKCLNRPRFRNKLRQLELAYLELFDIRNDYSPDTVIITHTYDVPFITGKGAKYLGVKLSGPWLTPALDSRGIPERLRRPVARLLIEGIRDTLLRVAQAKTARGKVLVADTVGTVTQESKWLNEIHPTSEGFEPVARKVYAELRKVVPGLPSW